VYCLKIAVFIGLQLGFVLTKHCIAGGSMRVRKEKNLRALPSAYPVFANKTVL